MLQGVAVAGFLFLLGSPGIALAQVVSPPVILSNDATLSALSSNIGTLSPSFDPATLNYALLMPLVAVPTISATTNDPNATVVISPVLIGTVSWNSLWVAGIATVVVTAQDGITKQTYTINLAPTGTIFLSTTPNPDGTISGPIIDATTATTTSDGLSVATYIPAGTVVTGPSTEWNSMIYPPMDNLAVAALAAIGSATSTPVLAAQPVSSIDIGFGRIPLTFTNHSVRIVFFGRAGTAVGFTHDWLIFTPITNVCNADSQAVGDALVFGDACYINVGSDLVVWTTHFSSYTVTTPNIILPPPPPLPLAPTDKDQCKDDDWQSFISPHFKNQGQCVNYVQTNDKNDKADTSVGNLPPNGSPNAKVKIIEYGNYYDPFSRMFFQNVEQQLRTKYIETGKVVMYWKDLVFPDLPGLLGDTSAANAARCANEQKMFWQYHDLLLTPPMGDPMGPLDFKGFGEQLGLNMTGFSRCLDAKRYQPLIEASSQNAVREGVNAVPTFFINGWPVIGAQPFDEFKRIIEEELAKQSKQHEYDSFREVKK